MKTRVSLSTLLVLEKIWFIQLICPLHPYNTSAKSSNGPMISERFLRFKYFVNLQGKHNIMYARFCLYSDNCLGLVKRLICIVKVILFRYRQNKQIMNIAVCHSMFCLISLSDRPCQPSNNTILIYGVQESIQQPLNDTVI